MVTYWQFLAIEEHTDTLRRSSNVIGPPGHESHCVFVQDAHFKLGQIWPERDASVFLSIKGFDVSIPCPAHVIIPSLWKTWTNWNDIFTFLGKKKLMRFTCLLTCLKIFFDSLQAVSTVNFVLKMLQSLAPYPLRPPKKHVLVWRCRTRKGATG